MSDTGFSTPRAARRAEWGVRLHELPLLVGLVLLWTMLWHEVSLLSVVSGIVVAVVVMRVFYLPPVELAGRFNVWYALLYLGYFLWHLALASWQVAWLPVLDHRRAVAHPVRLHPHDGGPHHLADPRIPRGRGGSLPVGPLPARAQHAHAEGDHRDAPRRAPHRAAARDERRLPGRDEGPAMSTAMTILTLAAGAGLTFTALAAIVRIVRGPTILDRMVASDVLLTTLMLAVGTDMVVRGHTDTIPLMTVIAATATFATIVVARYVKRRAESPATPPEPPRGAGHV
jgi:multisubunit Na+/H+ antiporter MnhF subunit